MGIEISTQVIHESFADVINSIEPNANIYDNPNQQGTVYPAWFIVHRSPVEVERNYCNERYLLTYQIDLWYMLQQNTTRMYDKYTAMAEKLMPRLKMLKIFGSDAHIHVYERSWGLELNALKFSTTLRINTKSDYNSVEETPMAVYNITEFIRESQN